KFNEKAFKALIRAAVALNTAGQAARAKKRAGGTRSFARHHGHVAFCTKAPYADLVAPGVPPRPEAPPLNRRFRKTPAVEFRRYRSSTPRYSAGPAQKPSSLPVPGQAL